MGRPALAAGLGLLLSLGCLLPGPAAGAPAPPLLAVPTLQAAPRTPNTERRTGVQSKLASPPSLAAASAALDQPDPSASERHLFATAPNQFPQLHAFSLPNVPNVSLPTASDAFVVSSSANSGGVGHPPSGSNVAATANSSGRGSLAHVVGHGSSTVNGESVITRAATTTAGDAIAAVNALEVNRDGLGQGSVDVQTAAGDGVAAAAGQAAGPGHSVTVLRDTTTEAGAATESAGAGDGRAAGAQASAEGGLAGAQASAEGARPAGPLAEGSATESGPSRRSRTNVRHLAHKCQRRTSSFS
ncbi:uncharacterized protein LOC119104287 [Pollicipes pollicipes]|uniref:uncharacterized protein LOC119104287 n=1 Tax=Pollicipes pollicipes TaxID=41117 RepID=UPI0018852E73|nr:uncharacterized protein LOC119104287 [Pollicipes pollicipes]